MLKLKDKDGRVKFVIRDSDTGPVDPDTLVLQDLNNNDDDDDESEQPEKTND